MGAKEILVIGPNPAYQKTLTFRGLQLDEVNRATQIRTYTGGKGTNFCRACKGYKGSDKYCETTLFMFTGGINGDRVNELLREEGIRTHPIRVPDETRTCITCLDADAQTMTELIEPSKPVTAEAADEMDEAAQRHLKQVAAVAIMGSLPDDTDPDLYTRWTRAAAAAKKPVLIDAAKGILPSLKVPDAHSILKVNMKELPKLTEKSNAAEAFAFAQQEWTVAILAITDGPGAAYIQVRGEPLKKIGVPKLDKIVSPLGAGDTTDAIFLSEYVHGTKPVDAFTKALAAASANCLNGDAGVFSLDDVNRIVTDIRVEEQR